MDRRGGGRGAFRPRDKLGFVKVAKYYYYPGWWEGGAQPHLLVNLEKWNGLQRNYQALVQACAR